MLAIPRRLGDSRSFWRPSLAGSISTGHRELDRLAGDDLVYGVGQFEQHAVRPRERADQDHCLAAGIHEMPRGVVDGDMDVPDTLGDTSSAPWPNTGTIRRFSARY